MQAFHSRNSNGIIIKTSLQTRRRAGPLQVLGKRRRGFKEPTKRIRTKTEVEEEEEIIQLPVVEERVFVPPKKSKGGKKRGKKHRKPTLKQKLLLKLRARKKILKRELSGVERDINSLICKRKKKNE